MKAFTIRFEDDVFDELSQLSKVSGQSKNSIVNLLVRSEYQKIVSDPKIEKTFQQLKKLKDFFEKLSDEVDS